MIQTPRRWSFTGLIVLLLFGSAAIADDARPDGPHGAQEVLLGTFSCQEPVGLQSSGAFDAKLTFQSTSRSPFSVAVSPSFTPNKPVSTSGTACDEALGRMREGTTNLGCSNGPSRARTDQFGGGRLEQRGFTFTCQGSPDQVVAIIGELGRKVLVESP